MNRKQIRAKKKQIKKLRKELDTTSRYREVLKVANGN